MRSLADRMRAFEQQKARLAETEAKLREAERRARTRRMADAGSLVEKAGLSELPREALYGALLSLRKGAEDAGQRQRWADIGAEALAEEAIELEAGREPILLTFPATPAKDAVVVLRAGGFRFNKVLRHWEGLAQFEDAQRLAAAYGGAARKAIPAGAAPDAAPE
jgi:hypothetical protein